MIKKTIKVEHHQELKIPTMHQNLQLESVCFMISTQPAPKLNDVLKEQNSKPAAFTKGAVEYHAERVTKLESRIMGFKADEDELMAAFEQAMESVTAAKNEIKTDIESVRDDIFNAEREREENNAVIQRRLDEIESLQVEIKERREFTNELETVTVPALEAEQRKNEARLNEVSDLEGNVNKKWNNRIKNVERKRSNLESRLTRLNLRKPKI